ncbi:MAG: hypothetical protein R3D43_07155 [Tepidamorphaceae bacterium]
MQKIAANDLSGAPEQSGLYPALQRAWRHRSRCDAPLHLADDLIWLITGSGFGVRDSAWVRRHLPDGVSIRDITNAYATLNICGPRSREVLQSVSDDDLSNAAFSFLAAREIEIRQRAGARRACRPCR